MLVVPPPDPLGAGRVPRAEGGAAHPRLHLVVDGAVGRVRRNRRRRLLLTREPPETHDQARDDDEERGRVSAQAEGEACDCARAHPHSNRSGFSSSRRFDYSRSMPSPMPSRCLLAHSPITRSSSSHPRCWLLYSKRFLTLSLLSASMWSARDPPSSPSSHAHGTRAATLLEVAAAAAAAAVVAHAALRKANIMLLQVMPAGGHVVRRPADLRGERFSEPRKSWAPPRSPAGRRGTKHGAMATTGSAPPPSRRAKLLAAHVLRMTPSTGGGYRHRNRWVKAVECVGVVVEIHGGPRFTLFHLDDASGLVTCILWRPTLRAKPSGSASVDHDASLELQVRLELHDDKLSLIEIGRVVKVQGRPNVYNGTMQIIVDSMRESSRDDRALPIAARKRARLLTLSHATRRGPARLERRERALARGARPPSRRLLNGMRRDGRRWKAWRRACSHPDRAYFHFFHASHSLFPPLSLSLTSAWPFSAICASFAAPFSSLARAP